MKDPRREALAALRSMSPRARKRLIDALATLLIEQNARALERERLREMTDG